MSKYREEKRYGRELTPVEAQAVTVGLEEPPPPPRYRVRLQALTPLAQPEMEIVAANETEARDMYMAANGISGSEHPWEITRL